MKTVGLITEYNPFHRGHAWHMQEAKRLSKADYCIVVMSGNFTQRGAPAVIDKFARADMALSCGADLVLELPVSYSLGSAEYFAMGAVSILDSLGVVDALCFGSECGNLSHLASLAEILEEEPETYRTFLREHLKIGESFPTARAAAMTEYLANSANTPISPELLNQPNNILGIEYLKALLRLDSSIEPFTIPRLGGAYHQTELDDTLSSASAIRRILNAPPHLLRSMSDPRSLLDPLEAELPDPVLQILRHQFGQTCPVSVRHFSSLLHYRLLQIQTPDELTLFQDISSDLADRIYTNIPAFEDFDQFVSLIKTKQYTESRIRRCFFHLLLDLQKKDLEHQILQGWNGYFRVLGFRKESSLLLNAIKKASPLPLITKLADAKSILSEDQMTFLKKDIHASEIYQSIVTSFYTHHAYSEYRRQILIR